MKKLLLTVLLMFALSQTHAQTNQYIFKEESKPIANSYVLTKDNFEANANDKTVFTLEKSATKKSLPPSSAYNITDSLKNKNIQMQSYNLDRKIVTNLPANKNSMESILDKNKVDIATPKSIKAKPLNEPELLPKKK